MQVRYQVSNHTVNDIKGNVTHADDALPQTCSSKKFLYIGQHLQVTPEIKIQEGESQSPHKPHHRPLTSPPVTRNCQCRNNLFYLMVQTYMTFYITQTMVICIVPKCVICTSKESFGECTKVYIILSKSCYNMVMWSIR